MAATAAGQRGPGEEAGVEVGAGGAQRLLEVGRGPGALRGVMAQAPSERFIEALRDAAAEGAGRDEVGLVGAGTVGIANSVTSVPSE